MVHPQTPPPDKLLPTPQMLKPPRHPCWLHSNRSFFIRYLLIRSSVHLSRSHKVVFQSSEDGHFQPVPVRWPICHRLRAQREREALLPPLPSIHCSLSYTKIYGQHMNVFYLFEAGTFFFVSSVKRLKKWIELNLWVAKNCFIGFNTRLEQSRSNGEIEIRYVQMTLDSVFFY